MASHAELAQALLACLSEVSGLLSSALDASHEERNALLNSDVEALVRSCRTQDDILRRVTEADLRAAQIATRLAQMSGLDSENIDAAALAKTAGAPFDRLLVAEMRRICEVAERLKEAHQINRSLLENGLEIVTSCLRTLASDATPPAYSSDAVFVEPKLQVIGLDRKA